MHFGVLQIGEGITGDHVLSSNKIIGDESSNIAKMKVDIPKPPHDKYLKKTDIPEEIPTVPPFGIIVTVYGYGLTSDLTEKQHQLKFHNAILISGQNCKEKHYPKGTPYINIEENMCLISDNSNNTLMQNYIDYGSPVVYNGQVFAITTSVDVQHTEKSAIVITPLKKHEDWLNLPFY